MSNLPAPRLQLRWRKPTAKERKRRCDWTCVYEIVIPLQKGDIRRKRKSSEFVKELCRTFCGTTNTNPDYAPFRDGAHALWDSEALGGIPIFIIAPDGTTRQHVKS